MKPTAQPATSLPSMPSLQRRPGQVWKFLAVGVFLASALPMTMLAGLLAWHQYRVLTTWPLADAVITRVEWIKGDGSRDAGTVHGARFSFHYAAGGRMYDSSADLEYRPAPISGREPRMAQMPVGSHHKLRYDPGNPRNISLATDFTRQAFAAPLTLARWAGMIAAVCVVIFLLGWRAGRRATADERPPQ